MFDRHASMNQILIDCLKMRHPHTGLFHFCFELGKSLVRLADVSREELSFYVPSQRRMVFGPGQRYLLHRKFHKFWFPDARRFDVWHSTHQNSNYLPASARTRMILTIHDLNFLVEWKSKPAKINHYLRRIQASIDRSDQVVCISNFTLCMVREHLKLGNRPAEVIYNGCNIAEYPDFDAPVYRPRGRFIFSLGTVLPKKNFHVLPCLLEGNDYQLVIGGVVNPEYARVISEAARHYAVEGRVRLLGCVTEQEKSWYYRECAAFVFPSVAEGFGLPVVEAMHYGKPIFLSNFASLPEIGGDAAYYFSSFEAGEMREIFRAGMLDFAIGERSGHVRQQALRFSWGEAARSYIHLYRRFGASPK